MVNRNSLVSPRHSALSKSIYTHASHAPSHARTGRHDAYRSHVHNNNQRTVSRVDTRASALPLLVCVVSSPRCDGSDRGSVADAV
jgi:hypothetical protein